MRLFLSYAHTDKWQVKQIAEILHHGNHDPWYDHRLLIGGDWKQQLLDSISSCDAFVYVLSPESVRSEWCQWEFSQAARLKKPIIPVLIQQNTEIPLAIKSRQYADFTEGPTNAGVARLMAGIAAAITIPLNEIPSAPNNPKGKPAHALTQSHIFISYSQKDSTYIKILESHLREQGFEVWIDHQGIKFGERWIKKIEKAIEECAAFIIVMSPNSKESEWVEREVHFAEECKKPIFPILLSGQIWFQFGTTQILDAKQAGIPNEEFIKRLAVYASRDSLLPKPNKQVISSKQSVLLGYVDDDPTVLHYSRAIIELIENEFDNTWQSLYQKEIFADEKFIEEKYHTTIANCQAYIAILGAFYGEICPLSDSSYIEYELNLAESYGKEIIIFLLPTEVKIDLELLAKHGPWMPHQLSLRKRVMEKQHLYSIHVISNPEDLIQEIKEFLANFKTTEKNIHPIIPELTNTKPFFAPGDFSHLSFDRHPIATYRIEDLDQTLLAAFLERPLSVNAARRAGLRRPTVQQHLRLLGLLYDDNETYLLPLGVLLAFAPAELLASKYDACSLQLVIYSDVKKSADKAEILRERDNLLNLWEIGLEFLNNKSGLRRVGQVGANNRDDLEIPEIALREALANALIHRDYNLHKDLPTRIDVFPDRIEITSRGLLPSGVSEERINSNPDSIESTPRNPLLALIFQYMTYMELNASGIGRMHESTQRAGLKPPKVIESPDTQSVKVTFYRPEKKQYLESSPREIFNKPRVFIAYSRKDGEEFARLFRTDLEISNIPLWQDRISMEGGSDWWASITDAIDNVEFMVLIATPEAMASPIIKKEWRYARQQGVCIYPVLMPQNYPDFAAMPRWMRDHHFYDYSIPEQRNKLFNDLSTRCWTPRVPFMVDDLPPGFILRNKEYDAIKYQLLDSDRHEPIAITAALRGAGGYGKTTIAKAICHDEDIQQAFDDGILWITLGENPTSLLQYIMDLLHILTNERPAYTTLEAAKARLKETLTDRDILLVIDDVWSVEHLRPFLGLGSRTATLITTRNDSLIPPNAPRIIVDAMTTNESIQLLTTGIELEGVDGSLLSNLTQKLGNWSLLLKLANGYLRNRIERGDAINKSIQHLTTILEKYGLSSLDVKNAHERQDAVAKTLSASFESLTPDEFERYQELAVFPEDLNVPLPVIHRLWKATGGMDQFDTERLCERLSNLSLLLELDYAQQTLRLHDVITQYLKQLATDKLENLHFTFLKTYELDDWSILPIDDFYMWRNLLYHLIGAHQEKQILDTFSNPIFLAMKTWIMGVTAVEKDLQHATLLLPNPNFLALRDVFASCAHLLSMASSYDEIVTTMYARIQHIEALHRQFELIERTFQKDYIAPWHNLPDQPDNALIRTISRDNSQVYWVNFASDGQLIVSASQDRTLTVHDLDGSKLFTLVGHTEAVRGCSFSPDNRLMVSASDDHSLKVWDIYSRQELFTLSGHSDAVQSCAVSPDGEMIISASRDCTIKLWNIQNGTEIRSFIGHSGAIYDSRISPDGRFIVSASRDQTLKIWDITTGEELRTFHGHTDSVYSCAISPDGRFIVSASRDQTLKIWDITTGEELRTFHGHTDSVYSCAISPDGRFIVSASRDQTLKIWDITTGEELQTFHGHTDSVYSCAISPDGRKIVSGSADSTLRLWKTELQPYRSTTGRGHTDWVTSCSFIGDGTTSVSASRDNTIRIWNTFDQKELMVLAGHSGSVNQFTVSDNGELIASASDDMTIKLWSSGTGQEILTLLGHTASVTACAINFKNDMIASVAMDRTLRIWNLTNGEQIKQYNINANILHDCCFIKDGKQIVIASDDSLTIWDISKGEIIATVSGHTGAVKSCIPITFTKLLASTSADGTIKIWNTEDHNEVATLVGHRGTVFSAAVNSKKNLLASVSDDLSLIVWDLSTYQPLTKFFANGPLFDCAWHPSKNRILVAGSMGLYFLKLES